MNVRRTTAWTLLVAAIGLTGCGSPSDLPTADTGSVRVAAQTGTDLPTPTFVPTALPASMPSSSAAPTPIESPSPVPDQPTAAPTAIMTASPAPSDAAANDGHPIARVIAEEFGVTVAEVEAYHAQGIGYGILAQFYSIANQRCGTQSAYTVDQLVAMKLGGMGLGDIRKQVLGNAAANQCSLGRLKQADLDAADNVQSGSPDDKGHSEDKGQADDKGKSEDKGQADDKGKGNSGKSDDKGKGNGGNGNGGKGKDK